MADRYCMHNQLMNDFIDDNFEGIRAPFTAGFELTAKCNLNCVHCYAKPDRTHQDFTTRTCIKWEKCAGVDINAYRATTLN